MTRMVRQTEDQIIERDATYSRGHQAAQIRGETCPRRTVVWLARRLCEFYIRMVRWNGGLLLAGLAGRGDSSL